MPFRDTFSRVFTLEVAIAGAVFALILAILTGALLHGRLRRAKSSQRHKNTVLESSWVLLLIGVAGFLTWYSINANGQEQPRRSDPPALTVRVVAFQWCWRFDYQSTGVSVSGTCGPRGTVPTLVLPTDKTVRIEVTSEDVVHEFWVPYLRYKVEALPDHTNSFDVRLTSTGRWIGRCSEFCGLYHAFMHFYLQAVSSSDYQRWLTSHMTT